MVLAVPLSSSQGENGMLRMRSYFRSFANASGTNPDMKIATQRVAFPVQTRRVRRGEYPIAGAFVRRAGRNEVGKRA